MNFSSFIGTIYIEKSSNLAKIWAEMKKHTLEYPCWTKEFQCPTWVFPCRNSKSNLGFPRLGNLLIMIFHTSKTNGWRGKFNSSLFYNIIRTLVGSLVLEFLDWSWKTLVGIPMSNIGIPMWVFSFLPNFYNLNEFIIIYWYNIHWIKNH